MNTTDDGMEPVGEDMPVGWMPIGAEHLHSPVPKLIVEADKLTAQTQALAEIRGFLVTVDGKRFTVTDQLGDWKLSGEKSCAAVIAAILERHGLT